MAEDETPAVDRLTPEQLARLQKVMVERGAKTNCELCGKDALQINPSLVSPVSLGAKGSGGYTMRLGGDVFPSVVVLCSNCGNTSGCA